MRFELSVLKIYVFVWISALSVPFFIAGHPLISPVGNVTVALVLSTIFALALFLFIFRLLGFYGSAQRARNSLKKINYKKFSRKTKLLIWIWIFIYLINIAGSGGVPLLWSLLGDPRTYIDFGLPTLGGLGNLLRAFILTSCYLLYFYSDLTLSKKRRYLWIGIFLLMSALVLDNSRGNFVVLILHPIALHFLFNKYKIIDVFKWTLIVLFFLVIFGYFQILRYASGYEYILTYAHDVGFNNVSFFQALLIPALMYISIPVINTDLNVQSSEVLTFHPYFSFQGIIPTFIRDRIFEKDYGDLVNDANNASSYFIPFVRDFGPLGAFIVISGIMFIVAYCYVKSRSGNLFALLCYPPLFMSMVLSFFSLYFTSLVVVLYPLLVIFSLRGSYIIPGTMSQGINDVQR